MYMKLTRIGPISCGLFFALLSLLIYLAISGYAFATKAFELFNTVNWPANMILQRFEMNTAGSMDPGSMHLIDLAYGAGTTFVSGLIFGLVFAIFYNIVAVLTGGIKVKTNELGYEDF